MMGVTTVYRRVNGNPARSWLTLACLFGTYLRCDSICTRSLLQPATFAIRQRRSTTGVLAILPELDRPLELQADKVSVAPNFARVTDAINSHGVVRINGVIAPRTAATLLAHVDQSLESALQSVRDYTALDSGDVGPMFFGNVLARRNRHDLKLDMAPPVQTAMDELLSVLGPTIAECLGHDAELYELAALISDPNSPQQPFHPDTPYRDDQGVAVLTAFVALQPIDATMGPTKFVPGSHTAAAHEAFNSQEDGGRAKLALLRSRPTYTGVLGTGDATLFDSRLLHCGGGNESPRRRVLFYASFRAKVAEAPPGSLLYELRGKHSLAELRGH